MTLQGLFVTDEEPTDYETGKQQVREIVKEAVSQFKDGHITEDLLKTIAEMAMVFEITESIEKKMSKRAKRLGL